MEDGEGRCDQESTKEPWCQSRLGAGIFHYRPGGNINCRFHFVILIILVKLSIYFDFFITKLNY